MKKEDKQYFDNFIRLAAVLVKTFGRNCEVAIHDFSQLPHSLVHIEGNVTQRTPGAPITDLVVRALRRDGDQIEDFYNYKTVTKGGRSLKSSTMFIRNGKGQVVGTFCVNFDITGLLNTASSIENFVQPTDLKENSHRETFASSLNETIESLMDETVKAMGRMPVAMSREEKIELVENLEFKGAFLLRGAVEFVAKAMGVSKYTVYNYLKEVRSKDNIV